MNTYVFQLDFGLGSGWETVPAYDIIRGSISKTDLLHKGLKSTVNSLKFQIKSDSTLLNKILASEQDILINVTKNSAPYFRGFLRDTHSLKMKTRDRNSLDLEAVDNSYILKNTINQNVYLTNQTVTYIVEHLLDMAGFGSAEYPVTTVTDQVEFFSIQASEKKSFERVLNDLLFDFKHVYFCTASGGIELFKITVDSVTTSNVFNDSNIYSKNQLQRREEQYDSIDVEYSLTQTMEDQIVFEDTTGGTAVYAARITLLPGQYYPKGSDGSTSVFSKFAFPDGEILSTSDHSGEFGLPAGISIVRQTYEDKQADLCFLNTSGVSQQITKLRVRATAIIKSGAGAVTWDGGTTEKTLRHRSTYLTTEDQAEDLAKHLYFYYQANKYQYQIESFSDYAVGVIVRVQNSGLGLDVYGRIISKVETENNPGVSKYLVEQMSAYTVTGSLNQVIVQQPPRVPISQYPTKDQIVTGFDSDEGTTAPATPTISANPKNDIILINVTPQEGLTNLAYYEIQVSENGTDWYSLRNDGLDWKGTLNAVTASYSSTYQHQNIPYVLDGVDIVGRELQYRARQRTRLDAVSDWSSVKSATTAPIVSAQLASRSITAIKIDVDDLFAQEITIKPGGFIQSQGYDGTNGFQIQSDGTAAFQKGTIGGWVIAPRKLSSGTGANRIELNEEKLRNSIIFDGNEVVAMGYLGGLPKRDGSGNWGSDSRGFWVKAEDSLAFDGDVELVAGDWIVQDAAIKIVNGSDPSEVYVRLGTIGTALPNGFQGRGLFLNEAGTGSTYRYASTSDYFYVGNDDVFMKFESGNLSLALTSFFVSTDITRTKGTIQVSQAGDITTGLTTPLELTTHTDATYGIINHASEVRIQTGDVDRLVVDSTGIITNPNSSATATDTTANRLLRVGDGGILNSNTTPIRTETESNSPATGFWRNETDYPDVCGVITGRGNSTRAVEFAGSIESVGFWARTQTSSNVWQSPVELYHTGNLTNTAHTWTELQTIKSSLYNNFLRMDRTEIGFGVWGFAPSRDPTSYSFKYALRFAYSADDVTFDTTVSITEDGDITTLGGAYIDGDVGIGATDPQGYKLRVNGDLKVDEQIIMPGHPTTGSIVIAEAVRSFTGNYNVAIGFEAGESLTTGANNVLLGGFSGSNVTGSTTQYDTVGVGHYSLYGSFGYRNVGIGAYSGGYASSSFNYITAIGHGAGHNSLNKITGAYKPGYTKSEDIIIQAGRAQLNVTMFWTTETEATVYNWINRAWNYSSVTNGIETSAMGFFGAHGIQMIRLVTGSPNKYEIYGLQTTAADHVNWELLKTIRQNNSTTIGSIMHLAMVPYFGN